MIGYSNVSTLGWGEYTALPSLPDGWQWRQRQNEWLLAKDNVGLWYFVHFLPDGNMRFELRRKAGLWDWLRTGGTLRIGTIYGDPRYTILIGKRGTVAKL